MTTEDLATGEGLQATITKITAIQSKNAAAGSKITVAVADADDNIIVRAAELKTALGDTAYNTLIAAELTSLNTALATAKTTAQTAFDALGA